MGILLLPQSLFERKNLFGARPGSFLDARAGLLRLSCELVKASRMAAAGGSQRDGTTRAAQVTYTV